MMVKIEIQKKYLKIGKASELLDWNKKEWLIYRCFETLPGIFVLMTFFLIFFLSWKKPIWVAIFIIIFDVYWLFRTIYLSFHLRKGYQLMKEYQKENWLEKLKNDEKIFWVSWQKIYHLIILPMSNEGFEVVNSTFESLSKSNYPKDKFIVVLTAEERYKEKILPIIEKIQEKFKNSFFRLLITIHPKDIGGELAGKGANATWGARQAKEKIIDPLNIPYEYIIVSNFDIDSNVPSDYFARLSYVYLTCKKPLRSSFQPIPLFINNIWEAPAFARLTAFSSTFWQMIQQSKKFDQITFSSHSMGFKPLVEIDFWQTNVVSEDSRIFWQCFLNFNGNWRVVPLYFPIYMDANVASTYFKTIKNQYKQQRRWAYGSENIPYFLFNFLKNKKLKLKLKIIWSFRILENFWSWATASLIIFMLGWLPIVLGGKEFSSMIIAYNLPRITSNLMTIASFGLIFSAVLSILLLPPRPPEYGKYKYLFMVLQWLLFPFQAILLGALPAIEAQLRLMLGKYMGFWVTEKFRKIKS